jgi:GMP synthase-like glutamine amidotransferase
MQLGAQFEVVQLFAAEPLPALDGYDGLVVLGGVMNAENDQHYPYLRDCVALLQDASRRRLLTLGICLGGQLVARSLGVRITRKEKTEIGFYPITITTAGQADPLFRNLPATLLTFQWHEDAFTLPVGATALADSPRDSLQAFRSGHSYGIQFHPEVEPWMLASWVRGGAKDLPYAADPTSEAELLRRGSDVEDRFAAQTAHLCRNLVALAQEHTAVSTHSYANT